MLQRGKSRISENVSVQALHERKQLNAKKIEQLKAKRSFVCFCFLFVFFVAWSNVMSYDVRCHACVQARLRELRGEDRVAEGQSGIVVWVVVVSARHCCYHNMIRHMPQPFELFELFEPFLHWQL